MNSAYIGLGSNLGDSLTVLSRAWGRLGQIPGIEPVRLSHPYRTEPVDMESENWFVNAAGEVRTTLPPGELLVRLQEVELLFGRQRDGVTGGYLDRILDLDLLLYGQRVIEENGLTVPHPGLAARLFVLVPLREIAADLRHPVLGRTMQELLGELTARGPQPAVERGDWPQEG